MTLKPLVPIGLGRLLYCCSTHGGSRHERDFFAFARTHDAGGHDKTVRMLRSVATLFHWNTYVLGGSYSGNEYVLKKHRSVVIGNIVHHIRRRQSTHEKLDRKAQQRIPSTASIPLRSLVTPRTTPLFCTYNQMNDSVSCKTLITRGLALSYKQRASHGA